MKFIPKYILAAALLIISVTTGLAQKYGHSNFGNLVAMMPESSVANSQLENYRKELIAKGEAMAADFQRKSSAFIAQVQNRELSPADQQQTQQALEKEQQDILAYEQEIIQKVQQKREELLGPIVRKAEKAVEDVARENGYQLIFDTSVFNAVLMADDSIDITAAVKAKLGL